MCLAIPARIIEIKSNRKAVAELGGIKREISVELLPEAKKGDYVLLHAGFAIQKIDENEARETLKIWKEINEIY